MGTPTPSAIHPPALGSMLNLAAKVLGGPPTDPEPLAGGGSTRGFFRIRRKEGPPDRPASVIGVIGDNKQENAALLGFTQHFAAQGLPVPILYGGNRKLGVYLMEDLGDTTLADQLNQWRLSPMGKEDGKAAAMKALTQVVAWLPRFQVYGGQGIDYGLCYQGREMDAFVFETDIEQFLLVYVSRHAPALKPSERVIAEMDALVARLGKVPRKHFCYRDFQARNIMWREGPVFLDYQSGRKGALQYDLASFLYSPDTGLTEPERTLLIDVYLKALEDTGETVDPITFLADFHQFVLIRRLQALGAYANLARTRGPQYFGKIPQSLVDLRILQQSGKLALGLPTLEAWLEKLFTTLPGKG